MKNSIVQILVFISLIYITIFFAFRSDSYCASSALIGQTLWNSYNIASEYYAARAGRNIINATETSTDLSGVSGISDGVASEDYSQIFSNNANFTAEYIMQNIRDVDVSELSLSEKAQLASIMAANNQSPYAYKAFTLGGITLYYAVDELGEWIGNSYDNIVCKFQSMTADKTTTTQQAATSLFGTHIPTCLIGHNIGFTVHKDTNSQYIKPINFSADYDLYVYAVNGVYYGVFPASELIGFINTNYQAKFNGHTHYYSPDDNSTHDYDYITIGWTNSIRPYSFVINNITYYYGPFNVNRNYTDGKTFSSLEEVKSLLEAYALSGYPPYESELIDSSGVPYVVPDLDGYGATIGDIYPVIDELREAILTIPDADSIASGLTGTLSDTIEDLIEAIKSLAITIPDVIEDDEPVPNPDPEFPDSIPVGYWPSFIPDLLDLDLFSIFKPVFDIVGEDYSMFSTWMLIPSILLFLIILYLVVSVF